MRSFLFLALMLGGCSWCETEITYPAYEGARDENTLRRLLSQRFACPTLWASGTAKSRDKESGKTRSFDFDLVLDKKRGGFLLAGYKSLTGTVFAFSSTPQSHLFADHMADPPTWFPLSAQSRLQLFGGVSLEELRNLFLVPDFPRDQLLEMKGSEISWGPWTFDGKSMVLKSCEQGPVRWEFTRWKISQEGPWIPEKWTVYLGENRLDLHFDGEIEINAELTDDDFKLDLDGLKKAE